MKISGGAVNGLGYQLFTFHNWQITTNQLVLALDSTTEPIVFVM